MGNGSDIKEIYQAVLEEVRSELPNMLIQYKESILQTTNQQYTGEATYSKREVADIIKRVAKLEEKNKQLENDITSLKQQISNSGREGTNYSSVGTSANSGYHFSDTVISLGFGYRFNGWVYYADPNMGNFLYKVRIDGTDNQQLTDYSVGGNFRIQDGKLYFRDGALKERSIYI